MRKNNWYKEQQRIKARISWMIKNKINWFQPTISPAPKFETEIESIEAAFNYYAENGVTDVILQTKFMGSYCNIYLHKNLEDTYFTSRNGHRIDHVDNKMLQDTLVDIHKELFTSNPNLEIIILEAELMPWATLGEKLIDREFNNYVTLHKSHLQTLKNSNIINKLNLLQFRKEIVEFKESYQLDPKTTKKKYKPHLFRQYEQIINHYVPDVETYTNSIDLYQKQVNIFGKKDDPHFKIFNILKYIYTDKEIINDNNSVYLQFNSDYVVLDCTNKGDLKFAQNFFKFVQQENLEGVVIKPLKFDPTNIEVPLGLKVRTKNYLQLIYGVNFDSNYKYYLEKRRVSKKLKASLMGYKFAYELLHIPYKDLKEDNTDYEKLLYKVLDEERFLKKLDNRL